MMKRYMTCNAYVDEAIEIERASSSDKDSYQCFNCLSQKSYEWSWVGLRLLCRACTVYFELNHEDRPLWKRPLRRWRHLHQ